MRYVSPNVEVLNNKEDGKEDLAISSLLPIIYPSVGILHTPPPPYVIIPNI